MRVLVAGWSWLPACDGLSVGGSPPAFVGLLELRDVAVDPSRTTSIRAHLGKESMLLPLVSRITEM